MPLSTSAAARRSPPRLRARASALAGSFLSLAVPVASAQYAPPVVVDVGIGIPPAVVTSIAAGDVDGDGNEDLVGVDDVANGSIGAALGTGGGAYAAPVLSPGTGALSGAFLLALGDFDLDGTLDAVYSGRSLNGGGVNVETVFVVQGDSSTPGAFLTGAPVRFFFSATDNITEITLTDFNGDTHLDILLAVRPGRRIVKIPGAPGLTFGPLVVVGNPAGDATDIDVCVDVNQDGIKDVVLASQSNGAIPGLVEVYAGQNVPGQWINPVPIATVAMPPNTRPINVHWIDCDQNGRYDMVVSLDGQVSGVVLLRNLGPPNFFNSAVAAPDLVLGTVPNSGVRVEVDFDGVEDLSLFTFNPQAASASSFSLLTVSDCQPAPVTSLTGGIFNSQKVDTTKARLHTVDDQNGDGREDLILVNHTTSAAAGKVFVYRNDVATSYSISPPKPKLAQKVQFKFTLQAPAALAGRPFKILFSANGTKPGVKLSPTVTLPLNPPFLGLQLDGVVPPGGAITLTTPMVSIPPDPQAFSAQIASAFLVFGSAPGSFAFVSNPAVVTVP